jgi:hypothetical protein
MMVRNMKVTWKFQVVIVGIRANGSDSVDYLTIIDMSNLYGEFMMVWIRNGAWVTPPSNG